MSSQRLIRSMVAWFAIVAFLAIGATQSHAQCIGPDNLDFNGQCCAQSQPNLPPFPAMKQQVQYICWRDCDIAKRRNLCVDLTAPTPHVFANGTTPGCGVFDIGVNLRTCGGAMNQIFTGRLLATYARTWFEDTPTPGAPDTQVWRFLLNGDLMVTPFLNGQFGNNNCVPQCHHSFNNQVYWFGYIDYRFNCTTNVWEVEWVVDHECDAYHHNADSGRPVPAGAVFHANRSFTFVGPSAFVATPATPIVAGPVMQENTRTLRYTGQNPIVCFRDDPIVQGALDPVADFCPCGPNGLPQYTFSLFQGTTQCGSNFMNSSQTTKEFVQKRLGFFPDAAGNPLKFVLLNMGDLEFRDACLGAVSFEYFEGVETMFGYPAFTFDPAGALMPLLPSSNRLNCSKIKGIPHYTCKLIDVNVP